MGALQFPPTKYKYFPFNGGLDLVTPPIEMSNGMLRSCTNLEIGINGGYARLAGYERFDGRPKPSAAVYAVISATITGSYASGNTLTGNTSGATGVICTTGTNGYFVLTKIVGTFQNGEALKVGGVQIATSTSVAMNNGASTGKLNAQYSNLAASQYRSDIQKVPGSGSILGVWIYNGIIYAFRNNAGGTAAVMYASSGSGWAAVTMYNEISFTAGGTATPADGATLTQGGVTATVQRVVQQSGAWSGSTAAGRFIITNPAGGNFGAGAATLTGGAGVTITAIQTAITLSPSGKYEFQNFNFGGQLGTKRMYGVDGKNRGFEFDGTTYVPITTGMTADTPTHMRVHKNQLFYSFAGSAQWSGIGTPYKWTIVSGAGEIAIGDNITSFLSVPGGTSTGALALYARNSTFMLYGSSSSDWNLVPFDPEAGAIEWTPQFITSGVCLDDKGITTLSTTQAFGNFESAVISTLIKPYLKDRIATVVASCVCRAKNQYRLFFSSGDAVYVTFGGSMGNALTGQRSGLQGMTTETFLDPVTCVCSMENSTTGMEEMYFGTTSGYVMQMDVGTSFDGQAITWTGELAFNHFGSPRMLKSFRKGVTEVTGSGYAEFSFSYVLSYGSTEFDASPTSTVVSSLSVANWDSFNWDQFFWDGQTLIPAESDITGTAENIALMFSGSSTDFLPFTLFSEVMHWTPRRGMR